MDLDTYSDMAKPIRLSIIVPAYNEATRIGPTLQKIFAYLARQSYAAEVLVVDDASTDKTADAVEKILSGKAHCRLLRNEKNIGKGGSVRRGMLEAQGELRLFSDADLSTPIEEVEKFFKQVPPFDVVIASRRVKGCNVAKRQPVMREASGRVFSLLVRLLTLRGFIDTQCGFKLFTAKAAEDIFRRQTINRFGFDVEILYIAKKMGYRIKESPVTWFDSPDTRVRFLRDATRMFLDLLIIRWNDVRGLYTK